ncbi:hypothetical protein J3Q30_04045 [Bordetella holmesii]|uniref:N-acetyltransferase YedL n=1 Tax=Bordetella holmesii 1058 TaxID=1247648 RepID=A0ABN0RXQ8_9BORD|nr:hypothetical protein [Bordetella holmesii]EXX94045.1 hypothetical protein D559_1454 [Bordetella holmesii 1058]MBO1239681.1 hypothetical protein [Bordetella holmesii]MBO1244577.1 hypothetical protein [Bordetella holmesii]MBO1247712.1 hypothetical protein [Bordetella holmesii]MBO1251715.1 hypothetical protein [Bordetella holmesii]
MSTYITATQGHTARDTAPWSSVAGLLAGVGASPHRAKPARRGAPRRRFCMPRTGPGLYVLEI